MESSASAAAPPSRLKIIHAGFLRTGTNSLATAYQILGFKTCHSLQALHDNPWPEIERAAEAKWPDIPGAPSPPRAPWTRADWDALWGQHYEVVTDLSAPFTPELIEAYPEAKVVVVYRDFEQWWPSYREIVFDRVMGGEDDGGVVVAAMPILQRMMTGDRSLGVLRKINQGFFGGRTRGECQAKAREAYERHYDEVRRLVPEERRLEYRLSDGWEPLCKFLGVPVPDVQFPRTNTRVTHYKVYRDGLSRLQLLGSTSFRVLMSMLRFVMGVLSAMVGRKL
ncbi:efflux pump antibiotic resistance protein [Staphylotrichum tortipilum]|uniref:Efflux pump antibiotic resistance protein n=1 Tax=Staphylotrichum tortipilum TaxID=2831512 RepID=A0AAN6RWG0_9PEZI|nr:efflux pump antibiotic resistance protein [Staphylotrichum longicolle]